MSDSIESVYEYFDEESPMATELRRLYHNLINREGGRKDRVFLITSSERGEGKSTIVSQLALTIAHFPNQKILVVDADLRRPKIHELFNVVNDYGFLECIRDKADPMEIVKDTPLDNLKVITAGGYISSPAQIFEDKAMDEFFGKAKFYFDMVLVDSPPILAVSDILFLCSRVDSVLFVIKVGSTPRQVVQRAKNILMDSHANIAGVVVNNASEVLPYYYDYKYYGYKRENV